MLGIDTNVLLRFLVRDDEEQFERSSRLIRAELEAGHRIFISQLVLLETEWVLRSRYRLDKTRIVATMTGLLESADLQLDDEAAIEEALFLWKDSTADFADCLIGARNRRSGCRATATFDARAARLPGFVAA